MAVIKFPNCANNQTLLWYKYPYAVACHRFMPLFLACNWNTTGPWSVILPTSIPKCCITCHPGVATIVMVFPFAVVHGR